MSAAASALPASRALVPSAGDAVHGEIAEIEQTMRADPRLYVRDEALQARYRDLIDARAGATPPPLPVTADAARRTALERLMRQPRSAYWRGPEAERLQAEFRALVATESGADGSTRPTPEAARVALPATIVAEWEAAGFASSLARAQDAAAAILSGLADSAAAPAFAAGFGALSEPIRVALYRELAAAAPSDAGEATAEEFEALAATLFGAALSGVWRDATPRRLGALIARFARVESCLKASHRVAFKGWWGQRSTREKIAVLWALGGAARG